jgi:uncharacterized protein
MKVFKIYFFLLLPVIALFSNNNIFPQQTNQKRYIPFTFKSGSSNVYGRFFKNSNDQPVPTIIMLQGFPGREDDLLGFGKIFRKEGFNALTFNYRGSWKSEGILSPETSLEDVITLIAFLKSKNISNKFNIDTNRIVLLGYSYGSSMALLGSLADPSVKKVISIGTTDWSVFTRLLKSNFKFRKAHQAYLDKVMSDSSVIRSFGGKATHEWPFANKDEYDLIKYAEKLSGKQIMLIGGWKDYAAKLEDHTIPLYRALQKNNAENVKIIVYDTDHTFRNVLEKLYRDIINWIKK